MVYDPVIVESYFDKYGEKEWERLAETIQGRTKYRIHSWFIEKYLPKRALRILDAGCGPGRFSLDLARTSVNLTLADISHKQLALAEHHLEKAGLLEKVREIIRLDITNMDDFEDEAFDAVVCYGSTLSYTYDQYEQALKELVRVLKPGGILLISVSSLFGTLRLVGPLDANYFLEDPDDHLDWTSVLSGGKVVLTKPGSNEFHLPLALFSSEGLRDLLEKFRLKVKGMATANPLVPQGAKTPNIEDSLEACEALSELELTACSSPGLLDSGEHLLAAAVKS